MKNVIEKLGLSIQSEFIPFSRSKFALNNPDVKEPWKRSLNWRVTLMLKDSPILVTEYSAGIAYCPSYKPFKRWTMDYYDAIVFETEVGRRAVLWPGGRSGVNPYARTEPIRPNPESVIACIALESGAIEYSTYEEWAADFGYDPDSRKGEAVYRECLQTGLMLRSRLGDDNLRQLREAARSEEDVQEEAPVARP
jgi:hypothetical protein